MATEREMMEEAIGAAMDRHAVVEADAGYSEALYLAGLRRACDMLLKRDGASVQVEAIAAIMRELEQPENHQT